MRKREVRRQNRRTKMKPKILMMLFRIKINLRKKNMNADLSKLEQSRVFTMKTSHLEEITSTLRYDVQITEITWLY